MPEPAGGLDAATIEKLRRRFPLSIDRMGRFVFDGDEITHPGILALFRAGLDVSDAGEPIVRVGPQWTYVHPTDCVLRVLGVRGEDERPVLRLDDGRSVALDPSTLWEEAGAGLRCSVPAAASGRPLSARFTNRAQMDLDAWIEWEDEEAVLVVGASRTRIANRDPG